MEFFVFSKIDIGLLDPEKAIQELQNYQQLAQSIKSKYQQVVKVVSQIDDMEEAKDVSFSISEFNKKFNEIYQEANRLIGEKERNIAQSAELIKQYDSLFNSVEHIYQKYKDLFNNQLNRDEDEYFPYSKIKHDVVDRLNSQWSTLQNNLIEKIEKELKSVSDLKLNLGVTGIFKDQIEGEISRNKTSADLYFKRFMQTLVLIPILVGLTYFVPIVSDLEWHEALLFRLTIALPLLWVAKWFSTNYTYSQLATIKFDHLNRLLGEGAPTIAKLVEADPEAKAEVYKRFAELFLDINDLASIATKQPKHPAEDLKDALDIQQKIKNLLK